VKKQIDAANIDDSVLKRQQAIISSMTKGERKNPKLLNASRKKRVAAGSGTSVQDINKLVKMHRQMADMMKAMGKKRGALSALFGGGMPQMPADMPAGGDLPKGADLPANFPGLPGGGLPGGLPGLPGAGFPGGMPPGLPGLPGRRKKKR
jgi:signal recognition particle subunit SRP54